MGNCIRCQSPAEWGGEDWTPVLMTADEMMAMKMEEEQNKVGYVSSSESKIKEVKVKVTRKQLEEWLGKMEVKQKGLCVEKALAKLVKVSVDCEIHHRTWRPMLHTIHED